MCTVSWVHQDEGYALFCNRDEKRLRAAAMGPEIKVQDGVRYVSPMDRAAGGTWIATNEFGISICLLNGRSRTLHGAFRSRGLLLPELISARSLVDAAQRLLVFDLGCFNGFMAVVLEPSQPASLMEWDGDSLSVFEWGELCMPLISSSVDPEGVGARRREDFVARVRQSGELNEQVLHDFHASHGEQADAYSTCMHRADAQTVSFSRVRVSRDAIEFSYSADAPCACSIAQIRRLDRVSCN